MKNYVTILITLLISILGFSQSTYPIRADTVLMQKVGGNTYLKVIGKGNFSDTLFLNKAKLPTGTNGYVWTSDANGNMSLQAASGGGTPSLPNRSVQINQNGSFHGTDSMIYNNGSLILKHNDSIGNILNYAWNQNPLNTWVDRTSTAIVTTNGVSTTISGAGLGLNLNNAFNLQRYVGVWNYTIRGTVKITQKNGTSYGFMINIPPSTGMGTGVSAHFLLSDTAGYIAYNNSTVIPNYTNTSKSTCKLIWSVNDIIDVTVQRVETYFIFTMTNRSNGSQCSLTIPRIFAQVGQPAIYFYSPTQLIENFTITYNESYGAQIGLMGNSIASGGVASTSIYKYFSIIQDKLGALGINLCGPGELSLDGTFRVGDMLSAHSKVLLYGYGVNDYSNSVPLDSFSNRVQRTIVPAIADGQIVVIVNLTPQSSGSLVTYNDTLQAIATRYSLRYVDIFSQLKGAGTAMNSIYDYGDGIHPNNAGHAVIAAAILNKISDLIDTIQSPLISQLPLSDNLQDRFVVVDGNNNFRYRPNVADTQYIFNIVPDNINAQTGGFNITGNGWISNEFRVGGNGGITSNPDFSVNFNGNGYVHALLLSTQNFITQPGNLSQFDGGIIRIANGAYLDMFTQPLTISTRNHNSTSGNLILTNLDNGFPITPAFRWINIVSSFNSTLDTLMYIDRGGGGHFDSTIVTPNIFIANSDTTAWKPVVVDASGNFRKGFWLGSGSPGGSSLFPTTGTGTATGAVTGDLAGNDLNILNDNGTYQGSVFVQSVGMTLNSYKDDFSSGASLQMQNNNGDNTDGMQVSLYGTSTFRSADLTDTVNYVNGSYVNKYWVLNHLGNLPASGANTALSNLASVAINSSLLPGTTNTIALGSGTKVYTGLFLDNTGIINFGNGNGVISNTSAAEMIVAPADGTFRIFKSGQEGNLQIINRGFSEGLSLNGHTMLIKSLSGTGAITFQTGGSEKIGIGGTPDASAKFHVISTTLASIPYPPMTTAQRNAISSPIAGDGVYCSDCTASDASTGVVTVYNGAVWKNLW